MAYNAILTDRVREELSHLKNVEEKKMFRGITFMLNGKMCLSVGNNELMCRIDPAIHDKLLETGKCRTMQMKGRDYIGYILVDEEHLKIKKQLEYWINYALEFNAKAKANGKKTKK